MDGTNRLLEQNWNKVPNSARRSCCADGARRGTRARLRRGGFSLTEVLVVIGLLVLFVAILLPVLSAVRSSAMKVVCTGRLRELTMASRMYCEDHDVFPQPPQQGQVDPLGKIVVGFRPHRISTTLLNQLRPYLKFAEVKPTTEVSELPPFVQCPFAEDLLIERGPTLSMFDAEVATYYTGYAYLARLEERPRVPAQSLSGTVSLLTAPVIDPGKILMPNRSATSRDKRRAVLWADHVYRSSLAGGFWQYTHSKRARPGPLPLTFATSEGLVGQHRGFTDASVEWVPVGQPGLEVDEKQPDRSAAFKRAGEHWWF